MLKSVNPYTLEINWEFELLNETQIDEKIKTAHKTFLEWETLPKTEKKKLFLNLAEVLEKDIDECSKLETIEMWMLNHVSKAWLQATANLIKWFANNFEKILEDKDFDSDWLKWKQIYEPIWVIFWIWPWNYPFNQILRAAVPNILAWNTQIYKHSSNVPMCALKIEELFKKAWFPEWVYTNIFVSSSKSEYIISNKLIAWVNLTWSENAWKAVWSLAWKYLKPSVLELWWNDAFVVCETSNLDKLIDWAIKWRTKNWWQACNASKRFIVLEKYYTEFCEKFAKKMESLKLWDPMNKNTELQPLVSEQAIVDIEKQIERAVKSWAKILTWWKRINWKWFFFEPTVLVNITETTSSFNEEIFWPVASIIKSSNIEESIKLANSSDFWLSACIYWDNTEQLKQIAWKLDWWMIFINQTAWSKASLPFWWIKKSGYGKENWPDGLKAFVNKKVILY